MNGGEWVFESPSSAHAKENDDRRGIAFADAAGGAAYLHVLLDDPNFAAPIQAALFERARGAELVWSRKGA